MLYDISFTPHIDNRLLQKQGSKTIYRPQKVRHLSMNTWTGKNILDTITTMMWWLYMYLSVIIFLDSNNNSSVHKGCRSWSGTRHHGQVIFHSKHRHWKLKLKKPQRLTSWWFQPLRKILVKMGSTSPKRGENKKYLKPPPSWWFFPRFIALSVEGFH